MKKRVLILDGSIYPDIYKPADDWRALLGDVPSDAVHMPSYEKVSDIEEYTHVIVTGSEASITVREPWYYDEAEVVKSAVEKDIPVLSSCFGHQLLAWSLSGEQYVRATPTPEIGWHPVDIIVDDPLFSGLKNPFSVFSAHFDEVINPPAPWRVIARSKGCSVHIMRFGDKPVWGIQAHPEIKPAAAQILLEGFVQKAPDKAHLVQPALSQIPKDDGLATEIVRRFLAWED